jgi:predicted alpha/beta-hydrolase family hydrolase
MLIHEVLSRNLPDRLLRRSGEHGVVLTHGAGSDCRAALLVEAANAFTAAGLHVLRCDLPFRQQRRSGLPSPATAAAARAGLRDAVEALRCIVPGAVLLGGHSYGGRQASILAADQPEAAAALLLFSYPLHRPGKAGQWRTEHFARLRVPAMFVQGVRDPFGSIEELRAALSILPVQTEVTPVEGVTSVKLVEIRD